MFCCLSAMHPRLKENIVAGAQLVGHSQQTTDEHTMQATLKKLAAVIKAGSRLLTLTNANPGGGRLGENTITNEAAAEDVIGSFLQAYATEASKPWFSAAAAMDRAAGLQAQVINHSEPVAATPVPPDASWFTPIKSANNAQTPSPPKESWDDRIPISRPWFSAASGGMQATPSSTGNDFADNSPHPHLKEWFRSEATTSTSAMVPHSTSRADSTVAYPQGVILKVDIPFEYLTEKNRNDFVQSFKQDICMFLPGVVPDQIIVTKLSKGSIAVTFNITPCYGEGAISEKTILDTFAGPVKLPSIGRPTTGPAVLENAATQQRGTTVT